MARSGIQNIHFDLSLDQIVDGLSAMADVASTLPTIIAPKSKYGAMRMGRREFLAWMDATARANPDNFMHLYKWGGSGANLIGNPEARLFTVAFRNTNAPISNAIIEYLTNDTPVKRPQDNAPGPDRRVRQVTFVHQARILEEWEGAFSTPRTAKAMVFWGDIRDREGQSTGEEGWVFVRQANTKYFQTRGQLTRAWNTFWTAIGSRHIPEYIYESVERGLQENVEPYIKAARVSNVAAARKMASTYTGSGMFSVTYKGKKLSPSQITKALNVKKPTPRARAIARKVVRRFEELGGGDV